MWLGIISLIVALVLGVPVAMDTFYATIPRLVPPEIDPSDPLSLPFGIQNQEQHIRHV